MKRLLLATLLIGCPPAAAPFHPVEVTAPTDGFARAMRGVVVAGNAVETSDEKSGVITTKWEEQHATMSLWMRLRWTIIVANGRMTIASQCQSQDRDTGPFIDNNWKDCPQQPADRNQKARELADAILKGGGQ